MKTQEIIANLESGKSVEMEDIFRIVPQDFYFDAKQLWDKLHNGRVLAYLLSSAEIFSDKSKGVESIKIVLGRIPLEKSRNLSGKEAKRFYITQMDLYNKRTANGIKSSQSAYEAELSTLFDEPLRSIPSGNATPGFFGMSEGRIYRTS